MPTASASGDIRLDSRALDRLFRAYGLPLPGSDLVLFAFRGALPARVPAGWVRSMRLRPAVVDHVHMRCTIGIWNRAKGMLFAAPGSTVPHRDNVAKAAARKGRLKGRGTNQLEPGYYTDLTKGEHLQGKRNGHAALRQTASRFYRRAPRGLPYGQGSPLYYGNPYDNLHCGWNRDDRKPGYSSSGCMVVAGLPHCPRREDATSNQGPWRTFHDLIYAAPQETFPILLAPAGEAVRLLHGGSGSGGLLFGSAGEAVKTLQRKLVKAGRYRGRITGRLDSRTYKAWKGRKRGPGETP